MLTVHHLNNSRSQRILWLLEELELPYQIRRYERDAKTLLAPPELQAVHPLGKSPLLTDHGRDGDITVAESGAIIEYLLDRYGHGRLMPAGGTADELHHRFWLHYAEGSLMPLLVMKLVVNSVPRAAPMLIRPLAKLIVGGLNQAFIDPQLDLHLGYVDAELRGREWFVGDQISAADIQMSFPLEAASVRGGAAPRPNIAAFVERVRARPAYQRAQQRGGPFAILG